MCLQEGYDDPSGGGGGYTGTDSGYGDTNTGSGDQGPRNTEFGSGRRGDDKSGFNQAGSGGCCCSCALMLRCTHVCWQTTRALQKCGSSDRSSPCACNTAQSDFVTRCAELFQWRSITNASLAYLHRAATPAVPTARAATTRTVSRAAAAPAPPATRYPQNRSGTAAKLSQLQCPAQP